MSVWQSQWRVGAVGGRAGQKFSAFGAVFTLIPADLAPNASLAAAFGARSPALLPEPLATNQATHPGDPRTSPGPWRPPGRRPDNLAAERGSRRVAARTGPPAPPREPCSTSAARPTPHLRSPGCRQFSPVCTTSTRPLSRGPGPSSPFALHSLFVPHWDIRFVDHSVGTEDQKPIEPAGKPAVV